MSCDPTFFGALYSCSSETVKAVKVKFHLGRDMHSHEHLLVITCNAQGRELQ